MDPYTVAIDSLPGVAVEHQIQQIEDTLDAAGVFSEIWLNITPDGVLTAVVDVDAETVDVARSRALKVITDRLESIGIHFVPDPRSLAS